jgi:hypothetical protein
MRRIGKVTHSFSLLCHHCIVSYFSLTFRAISFVPELTQELMPELKKAITFGLLLFLQLYQFSALHGSLQSHWILVILQALLGRHVI